MSAAPLERSLDVFHSTTATTRANRNNTTSATATGMPPSPHLNNSVPCASLLMSPYFGVDHRQSATKSWGSFGSYGATGLAVPPPLDLNGGGGGGWGSASSPIGSAASGAAPRSGGWCSPSSCSAAGSESPRPVIIPSTRGCHASHGIPVDVSPPPPQSLLPFAKLMKTINSTAPTTTALHHASSSSSAALAPFRIICTLAATVTTHRFSSTATTITTMYPSR